MKTSLLIIVMMILAPVIIGADEPSGCTTNVTQDRITEALIDSVAYEAGCQVKIDGAIDLDRALRDAYEFGKTGEIPQDVLDRLTEELNDAFKNRPSVSRHAMNLSKIIGISFDPITKQIVGLDVAPKNYIMAAVYGYDAGFNGCDFKK